MALERTLALGTLANGVQLGREHWRFPVDVKHSRCVV
jgi:hypothetical protein